MTDWGREAVYEAEKSAFLGTDLEVDIGEDSAIALGEAIVATSWWPGPAVRMRPARRDARSSSSRGSGNTADVVIRLATGQTTPATVAHEVAHALAGVRHGHDEVFRRAYLDVVRVMTNLDLADRRHELHADQLADAFAAFGLHVGERVWPEPTGFGDAIAL